MWRHTATGGVSSIILRLPVAGPMPRGELAAGPQDELASAARLQLSLGGFLQFLYSEEGREELFQNCLGQIGNDLAAIVTINLLRLGVPADDVTPPCEFQAQGTLQGARKATIRAAFQLKDRNTLERWTLESRLLAGESDQTISRKTGLSPEVVVNFEALFFHVRDVLGKHDFLLANVIGGGPIAGFQNNELGEFWCWMAVSGGPIALDFVLDQFPRGRRSGKQVSLADYFGPRSPAPLVLQAFVAMSMLPLTEQTARFFVRKGAELMEAGDLTKNKPARERIQQDIILAARKYLTGKPLDLRRAELRKTPAPFSQDASKQRDQLLAMFSSPSSWRRAEVRKQSTVSR